MTNEQIQALKAAAEIVTALDLDSAQLQRGNDGYYECPVCCGAGEVEAKTDFCNIDGVALGVQFYGIGEHHGAAEAYFRAAKPEIILSLLAERDADKALIAEQAKSIAELQSENEYIRKRFKETDLMFGKNILVMQAAIIEWQGTGDAKNGLAWIYNTLFGPGELPDEAEKDAQAYFDRKYAPLDEELMALHQWFWAQSEAERAAAGITLVVGE